MPFWFSDGSLNRFQRTLPCALYYADIVPINVLPFYEGCRRLTLPPLSHQSYPQVTLSISNPRYPSRACLSDCFYWNKTSVTLALHRSREIQHRVTDLRSQPYRARARSGTSFTLSNASNKPKASDSPLAGKAIATVSLSPEHGQFLHSATYLQSRRLALASLRSARSRYSECPQRA